MYAHDFCSAMLSVFLVVLFLPMVNGYVEVHYRWPARLRAELANR
jgi:hypothetical protein